MWRYSGNPASSPKDFVRYLVGDTVQGDGLLTDEEIEFCLLQGGNAPSSAAIFACEAIIARLSLTAIDQSLGSASVSLSQRLSNFRDLLARLRNQAARSAGVVAFAGGIEREDVRRQDCDHRFVRPKSSADAFSGNPHRDARITNPPLHPDRRGDEIVGGW